MTISGAPITTIRNVETAGCKAMAGDGRDPVSTEEFIDHYQNNASTQGEPSIMMSFSEAVGTCLKEKYVNFNNRAPRSEYWWFALFAWGVAIALSVLDSLIFNNPSGYGIFSTIWGLALLLPSIGVGVRRLHDLDKSGWWLLISFIPIIGFIILVFWFIQQGTRGQNRFGADPLN